MSHIVMLMGVDGSGKSSLTNMLHEELEKRGVRSVVVWATLRPVLMKPFILAAKFLLVRKHNKFEDYTKHIKAKREGMRKLSWTRHIYLFVILIDYLPQVLFKVYLPKLTGKLVICDRYYHDLVLDYGITTQATMEKILTLLSYARAIFPEPDLHYLVSVPSAVALSRKSDIPSAEYLEERAEVYNRFAEFLGSQVLDGTKPLDENCNRILSDVLRMPKLKSRLVDKPL